MSRLFSTIGWGLFCASSWTWCIGMYLPVLFIRHFGWPGFLVFAIPNVLGCAGFGYLCSRDRSERLSREHAPAMVVFSCVTIAYQVFFIGWIAQAFMMVDSRLPPSWLAALGAVVVGTIISLGKGRFWPILGSAVTFASLALWFVLSPTRLLDIPAIGDESTDKLIWTAPIVIFGFLLCPWLDRTFHRARQSAGAHAFGVFGIAFFLLILLTAAYTDEGVALLLPAVVAHMAMQVTFTIAAHLRELRLAPWPTTSRKRQLVILLPVIVGVVATELTFETTYLTFLGAYALAFPGYVLFFMRGRSAWNLSRATVAGFAALVATLVPFAAIGFIERKTWLLPIPVVILVLVALLNPLASATRAANVTKIE